MMNKFHQHIANGRFFGKGDKVILALSGGVDSVVLFHLLLELDVELHCAHVNYQLRGQASDEDEKFVRNLCEEHNISLEVMCIDTNDYAKKEKQSIQVAARNIRYNWFEKLLTTWSCKWLITAHHRDDSIETFFINLIRGTGLKGLTGIHEIRDNVCRPLLYASKGEILDYAKSEGITFRQDQSNLDNKYLRNSLRNNVIPRFLEVSPMFNKTMGDNMNRLEMTQSFLEENITILKKKYLKIGEARHELSKGILLEKSAQLLLHEILDSYGFTTSQIEDLMTDPQVGKKFIGVGWVLIVERENFILVKENYSQNFNTEYVIDEDFTKDHLPLNLDFDVQNIEDFTLDINPNIAFVDAEKMNYPLTLRKWKDGDKFQPFGMKGKKLISDFLTQLKISTSHRRDVWVLLSGDRVAWVIGFRIGHEFRITEDTKHVLKIENHGS